MRATLGAILFTELLRDPRVDSGIGKAELRAHDADDQVVAAQIDGPTDDVEIGAEALAPQRIAEQRGPRRAVLPSSSLNSLPA